MSTTFPLTSIDSYTHPNPNDPRNSTTSLSTQFSNIQDAVVALETKVGINSSSDNTSFDYKLSGVTPGDKAVSKTGTETLTNKTLTAPVINMGSDATGDLYYRTSGGAFARLPIGSAGQILNVDNSLLIPAWIANPSASNASLTVKGVVQNATQAQVDAGTATGSTGAALVVTPDILRARLINTGIVDTGSSTAYAIAPSPAITAYAMYQEFTFKAVNANTTATPTLAVNGLSSPKTIINSDGTSLKIGQITANSICHVVYDGTNMILTSGNTAKYKVLSGTKNAADASAAQTFAHGFGVIPKCVEIFASASNGVSGNNMTASSFYDGTNQVASSTYGAGNSVGNTQTFTLSTTTASSGDCTGVVTFDATNVTITWTKTSAPTGTYSLILKVTA